MTRIGHRHRALWAIMAALFAAGSALAATEFNFEYDATKYRQKKKGGRNWPRHTTVLMIVRHPTKIRPLFMYGKNQGGKLKVTFDDEGGLESRYMISTKGACRIQVNRYSVTRALDAPRIAATDWVKADPHPEVIVSVTGISGWKPADDNMKKLLSVSRKSDKKSLEALRAKYKVKLKGTIHVNKRQVPFSAPGELVFSEATGFFTMRLESVIKMKGSALGLTGADADAELSMRLFSSAYSEPPASFKAPKMDDVGGPSLDLDLGTDD